MWQDRSPVKLSHRQLQSLEDLQDQNWALPIPKYTREFARSHRCLRGSLAPFEFLSSEEWAASPELEELRGLTAQATENFTKTALVTLFKFPKVGSGKWMLETFACHARRTGIRPLLFVLNEETRQKVSAHPPLLGVHLPLLLSGVASFFEVPDKVDIGLLKWPAALAAMGAGAPSVFVSDVDVIWLRDPRPHLASFGREVEFMVALDSQGKHLQNPLERDRRDYWPINAGEWAADDHVPICCRGAFPFNAGQSYIVTGPESTALVKRIVSFHRLEVSWTRDHKGCHEDQTPMQWALYSHCAGRPERCKLLDPRLFMDFQLGKQLRRHELSRGPYTVHFDNEPKKEIMSNIMKTIRDACLN